MVVFKTIFIGPCKEIRDCFWLAYHRSMTSGRNWRQPANQSNKKVKPIVNLTFISTGASQSLPLFPSRFHCVVAVLIFCFDWWAFVIITVLFMQHSLQSTSIYNLAPVSRKALCRYLKMLLRIYPQPLPPPPFPLHEHAIHFVREFVRSSPNIHTNTKWRVCGMSIFPLNLVMEIINTNRW